MLSSIHSEDDVILHFSATNFHSSEEALRDRYGKRYAFFNFFLSMRFFYLKLQGVEMARIFHPPATAPLKNPQLRIQRVQLYRGYRPCTRLFCSDSP